ncbi:DUF167 domain-containing protein [bacterium]|nr:DUF167 domain-containing protein [bacterium]
MNRAINDCPGGCTVAVKVVPRASGNSVAAPEEGSQEPVWQIRLNAPAVEGKANAALQEYLAKILGLKRRQVSLKIGDKSRRKVIFAEGLTAAEAEECLKKNIK